VDVNVSESTNGSGMSMEKADNNRTTYHAFRPTPTSTLQSFAEHSEKEVINSYQ
jgi:hypothetical protein